MGFGYSRMLAWLVPLKKEISQQNWEANDNKVKLMLSHLSVIAGFLQGPCRRSNTIYFIV